MLYVTVNVLASSVVTLLTDSPAAFTIDTLIIDKSCEIHGQTQPPIETIIISNLILGDSITSTTNYFRMFNKLKVLIIGNIQAPKLKDASMMFYALGADYVELNLDLSDVINAESMFGYCNIKTFKAAIRFSPELKNAKNMFIDWISLTPSMLGNISTFNADIENAFKDCAFEQSLYSKLNRNNQLAVMTPDKKLDESIKEHINKQITNIITPRLVSLNFNVNKLMSKIDDIELNIRTLEQSIVTNINETVANNTRDIRSDVERMSTTVEKTNATVEKTNATMQRKIQELESKTNSNSFVITRAIQSEAEITSLVSRIQNIITSFDERVEILEQKYAMN